MLSLIEFKNTNNITGIQILTSRLWSSWNYLYNFFLTVINYIGQIFLKKIDMI